MAAKKRGKAKGGAKPQMSSDQPVAPKGKAAPKQGKAKKK